MPLALLILHLAKSRSQGLGILTVLNHVTQFLTIHFSLWISCVCVYVCTCVCVGTVFLKSPDKHVHDGIIIGMSHHQVSLNHRWHICDCHDCPLHVSLVVQASRNVSVCMIRSFNFIHILYHEVFCSRHPHLYSSYLWPPLPDFTAEFSWSGFIERGAGWRCLQERLQGATHSYQQGTQKLSLGTYTPSWFSLSPPLPPPLC